MSAIVPISEYDRQTTKAQSAVRRTKHRALTFTAADLGSMEFPPIKWIVPGVLPEGATILAGRPKLGKSWLALDLGLAVARGDYCLGDIKCETGDVLYLALEDNQRRLKWRINKLSPPASAEPWPERLCLATEWPRSDGGGLAEIERWAGSVEHPRLVIVDVLNQFRASRQTSETHYEADYAAVKGLQELAGRLRLGVLIVHHVRKGTGDFDPFERVSGTMGLTGAADTTIVLDRDGNGCSLYGRGRDISEFEKAVSFNKDTCRWMIQGEVADVRRTDERSEILAVLSTAEEPMSPTEIADATGMNRNNAKQLLYKMAKDGQVDKAGKGRYLRPSRSADADRE